MKRFLFFAELSMDEGLSANRLFCGDFDRVEDIVPLMSVPRAEMHEMIDRANGDFNVLDTATGEWHRPVMNNLWLPHLSKAELAEKELAALVALSNTPVPSTAT